MTNNKRNDLQPEVWLQKTYPSIYKWLKPQEAKATKRLDKGEYWWELRACEYYGEFEKPKIVIPVIIKRPEMTIDVNKIYSNDKTSIIASSSYYLL